MIELYIPVLLAIITTSSLQVLPVYNQAYQENYRADTIDDILANAHDAYVLIDPFENNIYKYIPKIHKANNQVSGYISVGTGEDWREDFDALKPYVSTKEWDAWPGEYFVSETTTGILDVMKKRIDKMAKWEMDWVEFDNMDWYDDASIHDAYGLKVTPSQAHAYVNALCDHTHLKGMKCMAKNTVAGFERFDGVLYESYSDNKNWWDTKGMQQFLDEGKLVIINHYDENDCDGVYAWYKQRYHTEKISFICEDRGLKRYRHFNE